MAWLGRYKVAAIVPAAGHAPWSRATPARWQVLQRGHLPHQDPPHRRPHDTLHAERFIRSVREERTDRLLMLDRGHAEKVLRDYPRNFTANHVGALGSCVTRRT
ncbi:hypothetical protein GCM10022232_91040 [Streptomyces plumbiresistens]|uniref:Uncharacterized protein n=1 Tax=Streptomyces plumbiresistens TaxID=511811 RepID=A0ABP7TV11_9ACTN